MALAPRAQAPREAGPKNRAMQGPQETLCFTCGQPAGEVPRLNCLPGGQVCPSCRDRLLLSLAPCLPSEAEPIESGAHEPPLDSSDENPAGTEGHHPLRVQKGPGRILHGESPDQPA
jgi:hypothetical protein